MSEIFISYKREDQSTARKLADALGQLGWSVWWDPKLQAGEDFEDAIEAALDEAKCIIVLWSAQSVKSKFVKDEARYARDHNKLLPVAIESTALPFRFRGIHTIQLVDWDGNKESPGFESLVEDVTAFLGPREVEAGEAGEAGSRSQAETDAERQDTPGTRPVARAAVDRSQQPVTKSRIRPLLLSGVALFVLAGTSWYAWDLYRQRSVGESIADIWENDGLAFCTQAIGGRYPIDRGASNEIKSEDFITFFGPGGKVDAFLNTLNTSDTPITLSSDAQQQFDRGKVVKEVFFRGGGFTQAIGFTLTPVDMDSSITRVTINLEGQRIQYNHGPRMSKNVRWPGPDWPGEVVIQIDPPTTAQYVSRESGPWAWLRVLDNADVKRTSAAKNFDVRFKVGNRSVSYRLKMASVRNAFKLPELEAFECPAELFE